VENKNFPNIITSHLGYFCHSEKICLINKETLVNPALKTLQLQCLENNYPYPNSEAWEIVKVMEVENADCHFGGYLKGDFSSVTRPGFYRVVAQMEGKQTQATDYSYPFLIHDEAFALLPAAFLEYLYAQRCGEAVSGYHGPCHLDDGIRSDNGQYIDTSGGWHDAGDCRKWMAYTPLPIRGLHRLKTEYYSHQQHDLNEEAKQEKSDAIIDELLHGLKFILKMQDPETGMIYEDVGGGKVIHSNKPWWFENFSGCAASNQDNRFTDNIKMSGDERTVRIQFNPMVQWTNIALLTEGASMIQNSFPDIAEKVLKAAVKCSDFMNKKKPGALKPENLEVPEDIETRTIVLAWKVSALINLAKIDKQFYHQYITPLENAVSELLDRQNKSPSAAEKSFCGFWFDSSAKKDPFKAVVHAAQPAIALLDFIESFPEHPLSNTAKTAVTSYFDNYILPIAGMSPFAVIPYGLYSREISEQHNNNGSADVFHRYNDDYTFRFFLPADTKHNMNIGINSHLASHMQSLALAWKVFNKRKYLELALRQLEWISGANPFSICLIYGFGFADPVPHSRFLGAIRGGIYNGYAGNTSDQPVLDLTGKMDWRTTEFWSPPLAGIMAALAYLLPKNLKPENRIGRHR
jgi:hypothetical protein